MVGILIAGHGRFASGMVSSLQVITGATKNVEAVDFEGDHSKTLLKENLNKAMDSLKECDGILVLTDLTGATPYTSVIECKLSRPNQNIDVVAGTNLPMLIEAVSLMQFYEDPVELGKEVIEVGKEYIVQFGIDKE